MTGKDKARQIMLQVAQSQVCVGSAVHRDSPLLGNSDGVSVRVKA